MSKCLIQDDYSRVFSPSLAAAIGLNEAIVLQQVHYWLSTSQHRIDGKVWVYNSYEAWNEQFPFWSFSMVKRVIRSLEKGGYLLSGNFNKSQMDQTKWYSIDYDKLEQLELAVVAKCTNEEKKHDDSMAQQETVSRSQEAIEGNNLNKPIPEITTKNTTKITPNNHSFYKKVIDYLNTQNNSRFQENNRKTQSLLRARQKEGYTLEDFQKVIDTKVREWRNHPQMSQYIRPETLFGNKFESYLHQKSVSQPLREEDFDLSDYD